MSGWVRVADRLEALHAHTHVYHTHMHTHRIEVERGRRCTRRHRGTMHILYSSYVEGEDYLRLTSAKQGSRDRTLLYFHLRNLKTSPSALGKPEDSQIKEYSHHPSTPSSPPRKKDIIPGCYTELLVRV